MMTINQKFGLNWDYKITYKYLGGMSDKTKRKVLDNMGLITDDVFWEENYKLDQLDLKKGFEENKSAIRQIALAFKQLHSVDIEYKG